VQGKIDNFVSCHNKIQVAINKISCIESNNVLSLMINMRIIFNFITMILINHKFNIHSNRFKKNNYIFFLLVRLSKLVQVGESS